MFGHGINDFFAVQNAVPDSDGLIEAILLPLLDVVVFPNMVTPLMVQRESDIAAINEAQRLRQTIIGVGQRDPEVLAPSPAGLYEVGTEMALGRLMNMPEGGANVLAQGRRRVEIVEFVQNEPP
jgi:ATP-dependent Lon protease